MAADAKHREVGIIRRAIEGALSPSATSAVLFEALSDYGQDLPTGGDELLNLVRGPLTRVLTSKLGEMEATRLVRHIEDELDDFPEIVVEQMGRAPVYHTGPGREVTAAVPTARAAVSVAVIAAGPAFANRLSTALGKKRVAPVALTDATALDALVDPPQIALVDATDFARIEPTVLAVALGRMPATTARVVWACDLPYGRSVLDAMRDIGVPSMPLRRAEGIEPLLDLIRSRRAIDPSR